MCPVGAALTHIRTLQFDWNTGSHFLLGEWDGGEGVIIHNVQYIIVNIELDSLVLVKYFF